MNSIESTLKEIKESFGNERVITDLESLTFYSTDVFKQADEIAVAVVRPDDADELISIAQICIKNEVSLVTRGGGASYTGLFTQSKKHLDH